ncbi:hypothetical protein J6590_030860 [Homalodisca vitripennis]|nr:hypothetical protein J6590_030860 [Homalodisca vitripennis]
MFGIYRYCSALPPLFLSACHDHPIENKREELVESQRDKERPPSPPPAPQTEHRTGSRARLANTARSYRCSLNHIDDLYFYRSLFRNRDLDLKTMTQNSTCNPNKLVNMQQIPRVPVVKSGSKVEKTNLRGESHLVYEAGKDTP